MSDRKPKSRGGVVYDTCWEVLVLGLFAWQAWMHDWWLLVPGVVLTALILLRGAAAWFQADIDRMKSQREQERLDAIVAVTLAAYRRGYKVEHVKVDLSKNHVDLTASPSPTLETE